MSEISKDLVEAIHLITGFDAALFKTMGLSLAISGLALVVASLLALPFGVLLGRFHFPGRSVFIFMLDVLQNISTVVIGLLVYILLAQNNLISLKNFMSFLSVSYPSTVIPASVLCALMAMILPVLILKIAQLTTKSWEIYHDILRSLGAGPIRQMWTLLCEMRFDLYAVMISAYGRMIGEVGVVIFVIGQIDLIAQQQVMTTAFVSQARQGNMKLAIALGMLLILLALSVTALTWILQIRGAKAKGAKVKGAQAKRRAKKNREICVS